MEEILDARIVLDEGKRKLIGEVICKEIEDSLKKNDPIYRKAVLSEQQYAQISKYKAMNKVCDTPWKGAADYFVPMSEWILDATHAREMNILFSQEPYMTATGVESSDVSNAPGVTDFVDMVFREIVRLRLSIDYFLKQRLKLPFSVLKYEWVNEFEPIIVKESALAFQNELGDTQYVLPNEMEKSVKVAELMIKGYQQTQETQEVWTLEDKEIVNAPQAKYIKFEDYVWCPNAKRGMKAYWEGDRFWMTINDIKLQGLQDKFIKEGINGVLKEIDTNLEGSEKIISERSSLRECFNWYGRFPFNNQNEVDFQSSDTIEQEVICIVDYKSKELLQIKHWDHHRIPKDRRVYIRAEYEETENFEGRSLCDKLYNTQQYINQFRNTLMNNAWICMQKIFVKKRTLQGADWEKPESYPGAMWEEDTQGDIRVLEMGDVKAVAWEVENSLINFGERLSNISVMQTGTQRQEGGQKTKGEIMATIAEGNIGLDKHIQDCHEILRELCRWTVDYYFDRMPPGLERRIRGDNGELIFPTKENLPMFQQKGIRPVWNKDDLAGQFDFIWNGTSLGASKQYQIAQSDFLMTQALPHPMISGNLLASWDIMRRAFISHGVKDWESLLPKKEAVVAEMQNMANQAKMRQAQITKPRPEEVAIKKLTGKGIPQEEAIKAVQEKVKNAQSQGTI
jgi:hypothetical protein